MTYNPRTDTVPRMTTYQLKACGPFTVQCLDTVMWLIGADGKRAAYVTSCGLFSPDGRCLTRNGDLHLPD